MKIRNGFVSNSSSSSFVIIDHSGDHVKLSPTYGKTYVIEGSYEFGWGPEIIYDIESRIAFAALQAREYGSNDSNWWEMLVDVIRKNSEVENVKYKLSTDFDSTSWSYIDHQSSAENCKNTEIFDSTEKLTSFIFGKKSYIHLDNDNC